MTRRRWPAWRAMTASPRFAIVMAPQMQKRRLTKPAGTREECIMKRWSAIASALLFAGIAAFSYSQQASGQADAGWVVLFDGKNLDNFSPIGDANWRIEDGVLVADKATKNSYMVSKKDYRDFQIRAECWVSDDANSAIFI